MVWRGRFGNVHCAVRGEMGVGGGGWVWAGGGGVHHSLQEYSMTYRHIAYL